MVTQVITLSSIVLGSLSWALPAVETETLIQRNDIVWGFDFFKDGRIVFTERGGNFGLYDPNTKKTTKLQGAPTVFSSGQGGLLDVRVHPKSQDIYFTYSEPVKGGATTALARAKLEKGQLTQVEKLFSAAASNKNKIHFGSRIEFKDGFIYMTVGDRDNREKAQDLTSHNGKILRLNEKGEPALGNLFTKKEGARPEVWSYGHRNPQGLTVDPKTGELWSAEFGPRGGDELNRIRAGLNYGWPVITYGREYYGPKIGEGTSKSGIEAPVAYWVPSISPSAVAIYRGDRYPGWEGSFFLACLSGTRLHRVKIEDGKVVEQEPLLQNLAARFRNVRVGPDQLIYFSTDDGKLGRILGRN